MELQAWEIRMCSTASTRVIQLSTSATSDVELLSEVSLRCGTESVLLQVVDQVARSADRKMSSGRSESLPGASPGPERTNCERANSRPFAFSTVPLESPHLPRMTPSR